MTTGLLTFPTTRLPITAGLQSIASGVRWDEEVHVVAVNNVACHIVVRGWILIFECYSVVLMLFEGGCRGRGSVHGLGRCRYRVKDRQSNNIRSSSRIFTAFGLSSHLLFLLSPSLLGVSVDCTDSGDNTSSESNRLLRLKDRVHWFIVAEKRMSFGLVLDVPESVSSVRAYIVNACSINWR